MKGLNISYKNRRIEKTIAPAKYNTASKKIQETGVYAIVCEAIKTAYVGQSTNLSGRLKNHKSNLVNNKHPISELQKDFNIYKEDFAFIILCNSEDDTDLLHLESYHIEQYLQKDYRLYNTILDTTEPGLIVYCQTKEYQKLLYKIHEALKSGKIKPMQLEYSLDSLEVHA
jgi:group I intron endonuclease